MSGLTKSAFPKVPKAGACSIIKSMIAKGLEQDAAAVGHTPLRGCGARVETR